MDCGLVLRFVGNFQYCRLGHYLTAPGGFEWIVDQTQSHIPGCCRTCQSARPVETPVVYCLALTQW